MRSPLPVPDRGDSHWPLATNNWQLTMGLIPRQNAPTNAVPFSMKDIEHAARQMLLRARAQADQLLAAAQAEGETMKQAMYAQGLADGLKQGQAQGQEEGRQKRAEAEVELRRLEGDLKQKLLSIRN